MCAVLHGCCSVFGSFVFLGLLPLRRQVRLRGAEDDLGLCNAQIGPVVVVSLRVTRSWGYVPPEAQYRCAGLAGWCRLSVLVFVSGELIRPLSLHACEVSALGPVTLRAASRFSRGPARAA